MLYIIITTTTTTTILLLDWYNHLLPTTTTRATTILTLRPLIQLNGIEDLYRTIFMISDISEKNLC